MTDEPISAYGGFRVPRAVLEAAAADLRSGAIPLHLNHELTRPLRVRGMDASVHLRADGIHELRFRAELHQDDAHWIDSHPGMSASLTTPLERDDGVTRGGTGDIQVSADHAWFSDDALVEAEEALIEHGVDREQLIIERAYQFALTPDPQIFVTVVLPLLTGLGTSAIWDSIKLLFHRRRTPRGGDSSLPTTINLSITDGDRTLTAAVRTDSESVAQRALEALDASVDQFFAVADPTDATGSDDGGEKRAVIWDDAVRQWTPPR